MRWTAHALRALVEREIDRFEAERTISEPEAVAPAESSRFVFMRRYLDTVSGRQMLLRVVVEDRMSERVVVTLYKTLRVNRYLEAKGR